MARVPHRGDGEGRRISIVLEGEALEHLGAALNGDFKRRPRGTASEQTPKIVKFPQDDWRTFNRSAQHS